MTVETVPREELYVSVKLGSTVMIAQVSLKQVKILVFLFLKYLGTMKNKKNVNIFIRQFYFELMDLFSCFFTLNDSVL